MITFWIAGVTGGKTAATGWHLTSNEVTLVVGVLAAGVGITSLIVTNIIANRRDRRKLLTDLRIQRLNEFYAPLIVLLDQDREIHNRLSDEKPAQWHILDHLEDVRADPVDGALAQKIVEINSRIKDVLEAKAGLVLGEVPSSFATFLLHHQILSQALKGLPYTKEPEGAQYFPRQFESDVRIGYQSLLDQLGKDLKE